MENVVIIGASGHGSVVLDCIEKEGRYKVVGFVDSFKKAGLSQCGYPILGSENDLPYILSAYDVSGGIVAVGDNWLRKCVVNKIRSIVPDFNFVKVVHPSAIIGKNVLVGEGSVVMPGVIVNSRAIIGDFCILNTNSSLEHDGILGAYSSLAPRACTGGNLVLGSFSAVGLGANLIENIEIGSHTVIGAGALVINHIPSEVIAYGTPAKVVRKRKIGERYLGRISHAFSKKNQESF